MTPGPRSPGAFVASELWSELVASTGVRGAVGPSGAGTGAGAAAALCVMWSWAFSSATSAQHMKPSMTPHFSVENVKLFPPLSSCYLVWPHPAYATCFVLIHP